MNTDPSYRRTRAQMPAGGDRALQLALVKVISGDPAGSQGAIAHKIAWDGEELVADDEQPIVLYHPGDQAHWAMYHIGAGRWVQVVAGAMICTFTITDDSPLTATVNRRPDGMDKLPHETSGSITLVNPLTVDIAVGMQGVAWYQGGEWVIINAKCP